MLRANRMMKWYGHKLPSSFIVAQIYWGVINHRQRCGKQKAKPMLVRQCPPCLLVKGTFNLHWRRLMCGRYLPVSSITFLENSQCAHIRKTNAIRAKGSSFAFSPIQQCRKIDAHNSVCLQSGRAWGILYVKSNLSNSSA